MEQPSIQTELKVAKSFLEDAEAKIHAKAAVIFELARRVYREPVPVKEPFSYGMFFGRPPAATRETPPLDIGTKAEYKQWLEEACREPRRDLDAATKHLAALDSRYPGSALIDEGAPRYPTRAMLAYAYLLTGDYAFYRCEWRAAVKAYQAAIRLDPGNAEILYHIAVAYCNDGDMGKARNFLERAVEVAPSSDVAVLALKQMERLAEAGVIRRTFQGSSGTLKGLIAITLLGLVVCLSCICCGLVGGFSELADEAGDPGLAAAVTIIAIIGGGIIFLVPAALTLFYYLAKKK